MRTGDELRFESIRLAVAPEGDAGEDARPMKIVGLYSDLPHGMLAMEVLRSIGHCFEGVCEFRAEWWQFDALAITTEREVLTKAASEADMLWWAVHTGQELPETVTRWSASWAASRPRTECALVALLSGVSACAIQKSPSWAYLRRLAQQAGMDFFAKRLERDLSRPDDAPMVSSAADAWLSAESYASRGQVRWGINE